MNSIIITKKVLTTAQFLSLKRAGVKGTIIDIGKGASRPTIFRDETFPNMIKRAQFAGLQAGGIWRATARTIEDAETEAKMCLRACRGTKPVLPIFYDVSDISSTRAKRLTQIIDTFCGMLADHHIKVGVRLNYMAAFKTRELQWDVISIDPKICKANGHRVVGVEEKLYEIKGLGTFRRVEITKEYDKMKWQTESDLPLRAEPDIKAEPKEIVPKGTIISGHMLASGWLHCQHNGEEGYLQLQDGEKRLINRIIQ